jgi:hypothetical protein
VDAARTALTDGRQRQLTEQLLCLNILRARTSRREESLDARVPDLVLGSADNHDPEYQAELADSVGVALLIVLDTLAPAERLRPSGSRSCCTTCSH